MPWEVRPHPMLRAVRSGPIPTLRYLMILGFVFFCFFTLGEQDSITIHRYVIDMYIIIYNTYCYCIVRIYIYLLRLQCIITTMYPSKYWYHQHVGFSSYKSTTWFPFFPLWALDYFPLLWLGSKNHFCCIKIQLHLTMGFWTVFFLEGGRHPTISDRHPKHPTFSTQLSWVSKERRSLEVLKSWQVGSVVWSDRAWCLGPSWPRWRHPTIASHP